MSAMFSKERYNPMAKILPPFMTIYGDIGIGKSTFCSTFPKPFFFDFENRTAHISNIIRDTDFSAGIDDIKNWAQFLENVASLKDSEYKTIVFDGITKLQLFVWEEVARQHNSDSSNRVVLDARDIPFGKGYARANTLFSQLIKLAKDLQRNHKKTIIFVAHEKIKEEDIPTHNEIAARQYFPDCDNGVMKILLKESDYIFRLCEEIATNRNFKTGESKASFAGLHLITDRRVNLECGILKTSMILPPKIKAHYDDFKKAWELGFKSVKAQTTTPEEIKIIPKHEPTLEEYLEDEVA